MTIKSSSFAEIHQSGLTFIEVMVALTVLGLISAGLLGGFAFGTRSWESVRSSSIATEETALAQQFLRRQLQRAHTSNGGASSSSSPILFGRSDSVTFQGPWASHVAQGSIYQFTLSHAGQDVVLAWKPSILLNEGVAKEKSGIASSRVLVPRIDHLKVQYYQGERGGDGRWTSEWNEGDSLPHLIQVQIEFRPGDHRFWPPLIVRMPRG